MEWHRLVIFGIAMIYSGYLIGRFIAENKASKASKEIRALKSKLTITKIQRDVAMRDDC